MKYLVILSILFLPCCGRNTQSGVKLTKADFGERWPLTIDEGIIDCVNQSVIFKTNKNTYAVNGTAKNRNEYSDIMEIWKVDTSYHDPNVRMDISPLLDAGLKLCK